MELDRLLLLLRFLVCVSIVLAARGEEEQLITSNSNFLSLIAGFTARIQCTLYKCGNRQEHREAIVRFWKYYYVY